jgi:hypothetical protein
MKSAAKLLTVLPCENGDRLEIYLESEYPRIVSYFLDSKRLGDCQSISEYEAKCIMHEEGFLNGPSIPNVPTTAKGELEC